jgi:hypothetical protein
MRKSASFGKAVTSFLARGKILNQSSFDPRQEVFKNYLLKREKCGSLSLSTPV